MKLLDKAKLEQNIEDIAKYDMDNGNLFGSSYYVYQSGEVAFKKHFGFSDAEGRVAASDNTIYRLASMTKPITAVAILILVDKGLLSLNDPVSKFLPEFRDVHIITADGKDLGKAKTHVSVMHCLTHTSGIGSIKNVSLTESERKDLFAATKRFAASGLDFEPFTKQAYSPFAAFDVLAAIVEKVTGQDYGEFLKNEIFTPCDMHNTTFSPTEEQWARVMAMHNKVDGASCVGTTCYRCVFEKIPAEHKLAGAGLVSTIDDYASFAAMLLNKGRINGHTVVSEDTMGMLSVPYVPKEIMPGYENWGLGVRVITDKAYRRLSVGSFGWSGAYGSHFFIDPENEICAVFMKNSRFDGGSGNASACRFEEAVFSSLI